MVFLRRLGTHTKPGESSKSFAEFTRVISLLHFRSCADGIVLRLLDFPMAGLLNSRRCPIT